MFVIQWHLPFIYAANLQRTTINLLPVGTSYASASASETIKTYTIFASVAGAGLLLAFIAALVAYMACKRNAKRKCKRRDSIKSQIRSPPSLAPPPYYSCSGLENKALENSMDIPLTKEDSKSAVYETQGGYGYHIARHVPPLAGQNMTNSDCKSLYLLYTYIFVYI